MARVMGEGVREVLIAAEQVPEDVLVGWDDASEAGGVGLLLLRRGGELRAWLNACPHAGRRLDYAPGKFLRRDDQLICAAHGATLSLDDGRCVAGPGQGGKLVAVPVEPCEAGWRLLLPSGV